MREWLKALRLENNLSQQKLGKLAGISQQHYNYIEIGKRNPHINTAKKIAEVLNFDWVRFFENSDKKLANNGKY